MQINNNHVTFFTCSQVMALWSSLVKRMLTMPSKS